MSEDTEVKNCTTCKHAVYDELWGEYKCRKRSRRVYILLDPEDCADYEKTKEKKKK